LIVFLEINTNLTKTCQLVIRRVYSCGAVIATTFHLVRI